MLQWACASIGAILVTLNPAYRLPELVGLISVCDLSSERRACVRCLEHMTTVPLLHIHYRAETVDTASALS